MFGHKLDRFNVAEVGSPTRHARCQKCAAWVEVRPGSEPKGVVSELQYSWLLIRVFRQVDGTG
jgi:hypothetical protein